MLKSELLRSEEGFENSEYYWKSFDGLNLFSRTWHPSGKPIAVIHLIHGLGEYCGRYNVWAQQFTEQGFLVRSFDLRGHGKSPGRRGYASAYRRLIKDIDTFVTMGNEMYSTIPSFVYGHSLGGNLVINYIINTNSKINGLIVTSPWLELTNPPSKLTLYGVSILSNILPGLITSNRLNPEDLSRDLRVVHAYKNDKLVHNRIGIKLFTQIFNAGIKASMSIYKINIPFLLMHGSDDKITSCKTSRNFVRNSSDKTTFIEWPGGYHELHNDLDRDKVFDSLISWLNKNI